MAGQTENNKQGTMRTKIQSYRCSVLCLPEVSAHAAVTRTNRLLIIVLEFEIGTLLRNNKVSNGFVVTYLVIRELDTFANVY